MAQIPSSAISAAVANAQRTRVDSLQARRAQALKTEHRAEDVAELEEGAITAVDEDESNHQPTDDETQDQSPDNPTPKKHLDIKSTGLIKSPAAPPTPALDIEA